MCDCDYVCYLVVRHLLLIVGARDERLELPLDLAGRNGCTTLLVELGDVGYDSRGVARVELLLDSDGVSIQ